MSRPKSLNTSRFPNARALILLSKHFYIWGIDATKIVSELGGGGLKLSPFFTFLKFWDYLENPTRYVNVPGSKKVFTHGKKTFDEMIFDPPPVFNNRGVRENVSFSII